MTLAEPEGYVRVFADEGPPMATLLRPLPNRGRSGVRPPARGCHVRWPDPVPQGQGGLIEPLSARELDVLRLLATDLTGRTSPGGCTCR